MSLRALVKADETRELEKNEIVLVDLTDFDVQIGVTENRGIQIFEVTDIVTRWMNSVFGECLVNSGWGEDDYAQFDTIILLQRTGRRLQDEEDSGTCCRGGAPVSPEKLIEIIPNLIPLFVLQKRKLVRASENSTLPNSRELPCLQRRQTKPRFLTRLCMIVSASPTWKTMCSSKAFRLPPLPGLVQQ